MRIRRPTFRRRLSEQVWAGKSIEKRVRRMGSTSRRRKKKKVAHKLAYFVSNLFSACVRASSVSASSRTRPARLVQPAHIFLHRDKDTTRTFRGGGGGGGGGSGHAAL